MKQHWQMDLGGGESVWSFGWLKRDLPATDREGVRQAGVDFYPCAVPGNFELDLFRAGQAPDPFYGMNPVSVAAYARDQYVWYARDFDLERLPWEESPVLVAEGLDCYAELYLNGEKLGEGDNMLVEQEFPIPLALLRETGNQLLVKIRPAYQEAKKYEYTALDYQAAINYESQYVRKAPHMYGWDIMPRFLSAGIWRPIRLEYRPAARIDQLYLFTSRLDCSKGRCSADMTLFYRIRSGNEPDAGFSMVVAGKCGDSSFRQEFPLYFDAGKHFFTIANPCLWWPRGSGEACLYDCEAVLYRGSEPVDVRRFRLGVRTVELKRTSLAKSEEEGQFAFHVNGEEVFIKGSNWVPLDAFHSRDRQRLPQAVALAEELNCNMLRCWGGNVYEDDLFYDLCDEKGILVWQDFAMACGIYPQDDGFARRLEEEAGKVIRRLRQHCCVALWSGDNECDGAWMGWGSVKVNPNCNRTTREVLPRAVICHDPVRSYLPSSPYSDEAAWELPAKFLSENHLWGLRDYYKGDFYRSSLCKFASEIGYHGCPSPASMKKYISPEKLWPWQGNEEWLLHSTAPLPGSGVAEYRVQLMADQIREVFRHPGENLADFASQSQIIQAEAFKFFIELFRGHKERRSGILWWNVLDGWPQISDAVVDYYFDKKLAYYVIRNLQQDVLVMLDEPNYWRQQVILANDTREEKAVSYRITDIATGETVGEGSRVLPPASCVADGFIPFDRRFQRMYKITWEGDCQGASHYLAGHPPFDYPQVLSWFRASGLFEEWTDKQRRWEQL